MCVVCGCAETPDHTHSHAHEHAHDHGHGHTHAHPHTHAATGDLHYGLGRARVSVPGLDEGRAIRLEADVLGANQRFAEANRSHFAAHGVAAWNLVSSPGSGKTTLLTATIRALQARVPARAIAVIEGDQQTAHDAERIRATGVPAIQVNTGKGCHLDAQMVGEAFARLPLYHGAHPHGHHDDHHEPAAEPALLFIENVGNLVCPAMWDLGERGKVAMLSVTEGEDKPLKYPDMFAAARLMVLTKTDLLPHVDFDIDRCIAYALRVNPAIEVLLVSARSGVGLDAWVDWLLDDAAQPAPLPAARPSGAVPACPL